MVAVGSDPFQRHLLFRVGHVRQVEQLIAALIAVFVPLAAEAHHLAGNAGKSGFHGALAGLEGLFNVGGGSAVRGAALQQAQLDAAHLDVERSLDHGSKPCGKTAQLGVAEAVGAGGLGFGDKAAVSVMDALGDGDKAVALFLINPLDVGDELIHIKVPLGQIDQIGAVALEPGQSSGGSEPAGVTSHTFHDGDHAGAVDLTVPGHFHDGGGDVLGSRGKTGAVVGAVQVVVDGLGHTDDPALIAHLGAIAADLVAGVHGVVAAVVEEVAHVVFAEDLKDALVIGVVLVGIGDLVAAGTKGRGGRIQ